METFYTRCVIANPADRARATTIQKLLVDTGSECTWAPAKSLERIGITPEKELNFVLANGQELTRKVGFAVIRVDGRVTIDEVVFAEPGDLLILGARTLEGLNLTIDAARKRLIGAGPHLAATPVRVR
jgi:predicted aspartyl protease